MMKNNENLTVYTVEDLRGNEPIRMLLKNMMSPTRGKKIGSIISIRQKVMEGKDPKRFSVIIPKKLIGRVIPQQARGNVPSYDWVTLIPENIPNECDPRIIKAVKGGKLEKSDLRINGNARDNIQPDADGNYVCEAEIGFNITEKIPSDRESKGMYTAVPYTTFFPRTGKVEGPEYMARVLIGPIQEIKDNSIVIGPSKNLYLRREETVEPVTIYLLLEPITH